MTLGDFLKQSKLHNKMTSLQWEHINETNKDNVFEAEGVVKDIVPGELRMYKSGLYYLKLNFNDDFKEKLLAIKRESKIKIRFKFCEVSISGISILFAGELVEIL